MPIVFASDFEALTIPRRVPFLAEEMAAHVIVDSRYRKCQAVKERDCLGTDQAAAACYENSHEPILRAAALPQRDLAASLRVYFADGNVRRQRLPRATHPNATKCNNRVNRTVIETAALHRCQDTTSNQYEAPKKSGSRPTFSPNACGISAR